MLAEAQTKFQKEKLSDFYTWVRAVWMTARGEPLDFESRPFLVEIYQDQFPSIIYQKAAQMGISERLISEAVWVPDQLGKVSLYTFPTQTHLQDFAQARLDPVIANSDYLRTRVEANKDTREKSLMKIGLKRIGHGFLYMRGSQNEKQITTIDADIVFLDERDRFDQHNVPFIDKRLLASTLKWRREASTPTIPGKGINKAFIESDQRIWQLECKKCGLWQELDFFKSIDFERQVVRCTKCGEEMNRLAMGRWHVTYPGRAVHGYKISGLFNPNTTVSSLLEKYRQAQLNGFSDLQQFFNQDLGLPYEVTGQSVQLSELESCKRDFTIPMPDTKGCYAGADVGVERIHVCVVQKTGPDTMRIVWAGTVMNFTGPFNSLEAIMKIYGVQTMVVDKKPEQTKVKEIMDMFPGHVYAADYPTIKFSLQQYYIWDDVKYDLRLDRTISLDYLIADIQNQRIEFPRNIEIVEGFYDQLMAVVRTIDPDKRTGTEVAKWIERGPDHFTHALNYARMAQIRGTVGQALLDYYRKPEIAVTPNFLDWLRINGQRLEG